MTEFLVVCGVVGFIVLFFGVVAFFAIRRGRRVRRVWQETAQAAGLQWEINPAPWGKIVGVLDGHEVDIGKAMAGHFHGAGGRAQLYTRVRVKHAAPLQLGLQITSKGIRQAHGGGVFITGDANFDDRFDVRYTPAAEEQVRSLLSVDVRGALMCHAPPVAELLVVTDESVFWTRKRFVTDQALLLDRIKELLQIARAVRVAHGRTLHPSTH